MSFKNHLSDFSTFTGSEPIYEMASSLIKLGVPKDLMRFIHKLSGEVVKWGHYSDVQHDPKTGEKLSTFRTVEEPGRAKLGPWPEREDIPLAHDIEVVGTKSGRKNIYHYLTQIIQSDKDIGIRLILSNPSKDQVWYLTRKTGRIGPKEREKRWGYFKTENQSREKAREEGISEKLGLYLRGVLIDPDSGIPIQAWLGTIGQLVDRHLPKDNEVDPNMKPVLYIMEDEDRVREKRGKRKEIKEVTGDQFLDYFINNFASIADRMLSGEKDKKEEEINKLIASINRENREEINNKIDELEGELENSKTTGKENLKSQLWNFLEKAFEEGEYEPSKRDRDQADLTDFVEKHTMPVAASMFLHYVILGRSAREFYTSSAVKQLGLEDLFDE